METLYGIKGIRKSFESAYLAIAQNEDTQTAVDQSGFKLEEAYQAFLRRHPDYQSHKTTAAETVQVISDFVNNFGLDEKEFISLLEREHRTIQQSVTKLMLKWLEHVASPEYRTDGRNEGSKQTAQWMLTAWNEWIEKNQPNTVGMPPSSWLHMI